MYKCIFARAPKLTIFCHLIKASLMLFHLITSYYLRHVIHLYVIIIVLRAAAILKHLKTYRYNVCMLVYSVNYFEHLVQSWPVPKNIAGKKMISYYLIRSESLTIFSSLFMNRFAITLLSVPAAGK